MANQPFKLFQFQSQDPKIESSEQEKKEKEQEYHQSLFEIWNTKPSPDYKLKFYNYYSEQVGVEFSLKTYNKFTPYHIPKLQHYLRFSSRLIPEQIESTKNSFYNSFMSDPHESSIIMKPYTGKYSRQVDYYFFKRG